MSNGNKPAHTIQIGLVKLTIWKNGSHYNSTITRSYKDGDQWKDGDSFGHADLPVLATAVGRAEAWIAAQ